MESKIAVIGMGYVGLPLALAFAEYADVIGFDNNAEKIEMYRAGEDPTDEVGAEAVRNSTVEFTDDAERLKDADIFIIAVPTPIKDDETPDLSPLISASEMVGTCLRPNGLVIYESTVYPGVTESVCAPILEKFSFLKYGEDFKVGYSPERIVPGDKEHTLFNISKLVSATDEESLERVAKLYELIIEAGVHKCASIKVAEAAKVTENCQRDINIAFVNELAMIFENMDIDTIEVLEAAGTKWNFLPFRPGLVGGHCIGVDPYYLIYDSRKQGFNPSLLARGRAINNSVATFVTDKIIKFMLHLDKAPKNANVYIMGLTFKENCPDIRNSKVYDIFRLLTSHGIHPKVADPVADPKEAATFYGESYVELERVKDADCLVFAVAHEEFRKYTTDDIDRMFGVNEHKILIDIKSVFDKNKMVESGYCYWRL